MSSWISSFFAALGVLIVVGLLLARVGLVLWRASELIATGGWGGLIVGIVVMGVLGVGIPLALLDGGEERSTAESADDCAS